MLMNFQVKPLNMSNCEDCFICDIIAQIDLHNDISKLLERVKQWDKINSKNNLNQYKKINKFECLVCIFKTFQFNDWKCHIMSLSHMKNCHRIENLYSYVCQYKKCKLLLYGPQKTLIKHNMDTHSFDGDVSSISTLMAEVMKRYLAVNLKPLYFCSHCRKFSETPIHTDVELLNIALKIPIEYYCRFCRVTFLSNPDMIDYHFLSVEHTTIKCLDELCSKTKINIEQKISEILKDMKNNDKINKKENTGINNFSLYNIQTIIPNIMQNIPVSQEYYDIKNEYIQNVELNKSLINLSVDETTFLGSGQTVKKSLINNKFFEKLNDDVQKSCDKSNENMELPNRNKHRPQYINYFKHKIKLLKKLKQHEDLIMKTLSYYCDVCDFIAVEKYVWDKHNQLEHSVDSCNTSITYCPTCCMFVGENYQEHNHTIEHSIFLNLLQLLKPIEVLKDKTSLIQLVESGSSVINSINLEQKGKIELNSFDCFEESKDNKKNNDCYLLKELNINKDNSLIMEDGILLFDKSESIYEHKQDETNTSNVTKLIDSEITTSNNLFNTSITIPFQKNVLEKKMPEKIDLVNVLTDDLNFENKTIDKFDEDQLYGEYVIQRLKNIKDITIKQLIKLEIDNIFYTKMKQLIH